MLKLREYSRIAERVYRGELPNGLRITVVPKPGASKTMAFLAVNYGGVDRRFRLGANPVETPAGAAHFLEHRMFATPDGDAMTVLSKLGANANAFTSSDMTAYHFECTEGFDQDLRILLKAVTTPWFPEEDVERERDIIAQEICETLDDPDDNMYYAFLRCLYARTPLREPVAGTLESIAGIDAETLYTCFRAFYTPSNMSLVVIGAADPKQVRDIALESTPPDWAPAARREPPEPEGPMPVSVRTERAMDVGAPMFLAGSKTAPGLMGRESVKFELTASLALSSLMGRASPLYSRLYSEGLINETFGYDFENSAGFSSLSFGGEAQDPELVCLRVLEEAARAAATGIDPDFFQRRRKTTWGGVIRALNSFDNICYNVAAADFCGYDYFETVDVLETVTREDARSFIAEYMTPERTAISIINRRER